MTNAGLSFPQSSTNPVATGDMGSSVALYLGDWNGDGIADAMTWNPSTGANKWFVNNGSLGFTIYTNPIAAAQITGSATQLHLGDWNGDGIADVMWWKPSDGTNRWFTNNGALSFAQTNNPIAQSHVTGGEIHFGDWNGDGIADALWRFEGNNRWFINNGALSFSTTTNPITIQRQWQEWAYGGTELITQYQVAQLAFQDWNGDGLVDVLAYYEPTVSGPGEACEWFINDGALQFTSATSNFCVAVSDSAYGGYSVYGDWNGDGIADILFWNPSSGANVWYLNDGALTFTVIINPIAHATISGSIIYAGDWNGDGVDDAMFHWPGSGTNRWFTTSWNGSGQLSFAYTADLLTPSQVSGTGGVLSLGDWNGDGFADAMWRLASNGTNRWYWQNGLTAQDRLASTTT
ncbi:MAG TPA: VCBS repeat-containing protein, partial [Lacipirellulaceae bacterium]|nr:VCBS repeat-containing protein [Lacipirellulaceae bacterium]